MRLELAGSLIRPDPMVVKYTGNGEFVPQDYMDFGYTHFEVICIGGGGGPGGGINTAHSGTQIRNFGGRGGGGGFQRVRGLLSALPTSCPVVIGVGGTVGLDHISDPALTTDGGDGGASTFNFITCRASGGKGGKRAQSNSPTVTTQADGGDGGIGNRSIAGGGASGGTAGTPTALGPGTPGTNGGDGTIFNNIGQGGGGGAGGVGTMAAVTCNPATSGGRGSYNPGDTSVYGPGDAPSDAEAEEGGAASIIPGRASGAKASPLNGLPTVYGRSGDAGTVILYLTALVISKPTPPVGPPGQNTVYGRLRFDSIFTSVINAYSTGTTMPNSYGAGAYGRGPFIGGQQTLGQVARVTTFGSVIAGVRSGPTVKQTAVAEISLASHVTPSVRTNHSIKVRARTTTGSTGVLKMALYEGATKRTSDLITPPLTNVLTDYTLNISEAEAATITSYANLSIRIWGYDSANNALVFQVVRLYLELPSA